MFNTVIFCLFTSHLNFPSPFLSKLSLGPILFLPYHQILIQPHSSVPSSASSCACEEPSLDHFLNFPLASSHSQSPWWAFHFGLPLQLCLASPSNLLSLTNSLLFLHHSSSSRTLLSHPFLPSLVHITFISPVLPVFCIPTLSSVNRLNAEAAKAETVQPHPRSIRHHSTEPLCGMDACAI